MTEITLGELIKKARKRKIDLGSNPEQVIRFYTKLGLIPKPKRKRAKDARLKATELHYPESALDKLAQIKALKSEGLSLDEIRDSFAFEYVSDALRDLMSRADDKKLKQLAHIIGSEDRELESIVEAPLVYIMEGMSQEEVKRLLSLFCGVGFYALLEAQQALEGFKVNEARRALFKSIFYNSIAVLRLARTTGDTKLESTALEIYENMVLSPLRKASERVRREFVKSIEMHVKEKELKKSKA